MTDKVLYEARDGVAWITLNRPELRNAIDLEMRNALSHLGEVSVLRGMKGLAELPI